MTFVSGGRVQGPPQPQGAPQDAGPQGPPQNAGPQGPPGTAAQP